MKIKYILIIILMLFVCGCTRVENESIENVIQNINNNTNTYNVYHTGYKYYLPIGLTESEYSTFNSVIESNDFTMYLYVDGVSYLNKSDIDYTQNKNAYYSASLSDEDKKGYIEINLDENDQYLIEIMFNYAKIEVMVDEKDINLAVSYATSILGSIEYNDSVITNLLGDDVLSYQEEIYNVFNSTSSDSTYLKRVEEDNNQEENSVEDTDLLK